MKLLLLFCIITFIVAIDSFDIKQHLGSKTPYWSSGSIKPSPAPTGCSAVHIDLVARHGVRAPTSGNIASLNTLAAQLKQYQSYISDQYPYIKNWTNPFPLIQAGFLSYAGEIEHYTLAKRLAENYRPILSQEYWSNVYVYQSTQVSRSGVSANSFAFGQTEGQGKVGKSNYEPFYIFSESPSMDNLRFFDNCPKYTDILDSGVADVELNKCQSMNYDAIAMRLSKTLGVYPVWNISSKTLDTMFSACAFEVSVSNKADGWCSIFTQSDIETIEFCQDLGTYYECGYGIDLSYQISSPVLKDIVTTMDGVIAKNSAYSGQLAYLRFAHAETVMPLAALLGLFKDSEKLTASSSAGVIQNRKWRTSVVSPFTANIMLVLYECSDKYLVKLLHDEVEYEIPGCKGMYCEYNLFKSLYAQALSFNYTKACAKTDDLSSTQYLVSVWQESWLVVLGVFLGATVVALGSFLYMKRGQLQQRYSLLRSSTTDIDS